jgi:hypothetical protein
MYHFVLHTGKRATRKSRVLRMERSKLLRNSNSAVCLQYRVLQNKFFFVELRCRCVECGRSRADRDACGHIACSVVLSQQAHTMHGRHRTRRTGVRFEKEGPSGERVCHMMCVVCQGNQSRSPTRSLKLHCEIPQSGRKVVWQMTIHRYHVHILAQ